MSPRRITRPDLHRTAPAEEYGVFFLGGGGGGGEAGLYMFSGLSCVTRHAEALIPFARRGARDEVDAGGGSGVGNRGERGVNEG